jgi:hypothetical protein
MVNEKEIINELNQYPKNLDIPADLEGRVMNLIKKEGRKEKRISPVFLGSLGTIAAGVIIFLLVITSGGIQNHEKHNAASVKHVLPNPNYHLNHTKPKKDYFPDNKENVTLPLEEAQKLSPYQLLKPTYSPFKIKNSYVSLFDNPSGNRDQEVLITYIGDNKQYMEIEMHNKENIYGGAMKNNYEEVDLFQGVKGYVQISNDATLFWSTDGYTILVSLPNKNNQYTKSDIIKIARSLHNIG